MEHLPQEIQNKIFYFYAEHPCAIMIKQHFCCVGCGAFSTFRRKCYYCKSIFCLGCKFFEYFVIKSRGKYVCIGCIIKSIARNKLKLI